jgi:hypothetical protein
MSLKARLNRLDGEIEWLRWWGRLRAVELRMDLLAARRKLAKAQEDRVRAEKEEARRREAARAEAVEQQKRLLEPPPLPPKPPPEVLPTPPPAAKSKPPPLAPMGGQPCSEIPEHMQIRPVSWGSRSYEPYDSGGKCLVDYDPLADEDDEA